MGGHGKPNVKEDHQNNAIKGNEGGLKGYPLEALIRRWNGQLFIKGFNKELSSGSFSFPEFQT